MVWSSDDGEGVGKVVAVRSLPYIENHQTLETSWGSYKRGWGVLEKGGIEK